MLDAQIISPFPRGASPRRVLPKALSRAASTGASAPTGTSCRSLREFVEDVRHSFEELAEHSGVTTGPTPCLAPGRVRFHGLSRGRLRGAALGQQPPSSGSGFSCDSGGRTGGQFGIATFEMGSGPESVTHRRIHLRPGHPPDPLRRLVRR